MFKPYWHLWIDDSWKPPNHRIGCRSFPHEHRTIWTPNTDVSVSGFPRMALIYNVFSCFFTEELLFCYIRLFPKGPEPSWGCPLAPKTFLWKYGLRHIDWQALTRPPRTIFWLFQFGWVTMVTWCDMTHSLPVWFPKGWILWVGPTDRLRLGLIVRSIIVCPFAFEGPLVQRKTPKEKHLSKPFLVHVSLLQRLYPVDPHS